MRTTRRRPQGLLRQALRLARTLEEIAPEATRRRPLLFAGYGFLVRNRRLAAAVSHLGERSAYESGILVRTMLEIKVNYSWIRLRNSYSRALRFYRYWSLERLKLLEKAAAILRPDDYGARKKALEQARRKVRRLFRYRDAKGNMRWASSWAQLASVEARLAEVSRKQNPAQPDLFQYALYVALSSSVHGSPGSLQQVLRVRQRRLRPARQPETEPQRHIVGALVLLMWTIDTFATDSKRRRALQPELRVLASEVKGLSSQRKEQRRKVARQQARAGRLDAGPSA